VHQNYTKYEEGGATQIPCQLFQTPWVPDESDGPGHDFGQFDRRKEDSQVIAELLIRVPNYGTRGSNWVQRLAYLDEHMDLLVDGLDKVVLN
jgi:hypothetical protein